MCQQVINQHGKIQSKIPFGILDPVTRKITAKMIDSLPAPASIEPISKST